MEEILQLSEGQLPLLIGGAVLLLVIIGWIIYRRRRSRTARVRLQRASHDVLAEFIIPDGNEGEIEVEFALLTNLGVVVVDIKDVKGNVFGSDAMDDWTVISQHRRFTFSNPQHALYDRMAAIKRLMPDVPVIGYIAFTERAEFNKGQPENVILLDQLVDELARAKADKANLLLTEYQPQWDRLRDEAVAAQVGRLLHD